MKIINVCGARPNFMKIAPLMHAYRRVDAIHPILVHTGQHYDDRMNRWFFDELDIPNPDINLEVGSGSHAVQTAEIMKRFEPVCLDHQPDAVLVVGDVNSTIACALVAVKLNIPAIHVEAGLRSFDRTMPEEINRLMTDAICSLLFVTEQSGLDNLRREGVPDDRVHFVGNVMIDTLNRMRAAAERSQILKTLNVAPRAYTVLTLHRPSNVDDPATFSRILDALAEIQKSRAVVFPVHPRTRANIERGAFGARIASMTGLKMVEPLGYLDFVHLLTHAACVLTDSGGIQEETTILGVPCLTLRENTERPVTITGGTNRLVGTDPSVILDGFRNALASGATPKTPPLWDGRAAERIVDVLRRWAR
ncbi:MAG: UDP-N-acetylglucosamine 2-epimerase (non-hydrolyzing) [Phycisphaerales bacterium]|nr:UDP-N-acetylglucosamine 2-epimerase (non-hydrolyzing) [Phycisphaerales bacterium]